MEVDLIHLLEGNEKSRLTRAALLKYLPPIFGRSERCPIMDGERLIVPLKLSRKTLTSEYSALYSVAGLATFSHCLSLFRGLKRSSDYMHAHNYECSKSLLISEIMEPDLVQSE